MPEIDAQKGHYELPVNAPNKSVFHYSKHQ
jgi:hypothetical protein